MEKNKDMNFIKTTVILMIATLMVSCIKEEPLNSECDIITAQLPDIVLVDNTIISNNNVEFTVRYDQPWPEYAPVFTITEGATISPSNGTVRDFTQPQTYTVTSQDGKWHKTYTVRVKRQNAPEDPKDEFIYMHYNFEHVRTLTTVGRTYDVFYEIDNEGEEEWAWATANSAYALTLQGKEPQDFPTYQANEGIDGKCAVLVTRGTGSFGASVKKPMADRQSVYGLIRSQKRIAKAVRSHTLRNAL